MKKICMVFALIFISLSAQTETLSLYCESGDPGGLGPVLYLDLNEQGNALEAALELNINSVDPENRKPNINIKRHLVEKNASSSNQWLFLVSAAYQIRVAKDSYEHSNAWYAIVESRSNKFSAIELSCQ